MISWIELISEEQIAQIRQLSHQRPQLIFKHSTRCSTSFLAKSRLEREDAPLGVDCYLLDLIRYRPISNKIAEDLSVFHESPQVILVIDGDAIYDESHLGIYMSEIAQAIQEHIGMKTR